MFGLSPANVCVTCVLRQMHGDGLPECSRSRGARAVPHRCSAERGARGGEIGWVRRWRQCFVSSSCRVRKSLACMCLPSEVEPAYWNENIGVVKFAVLLLCGFSKGYVCMLHAFLDEGFMFFFVLAHTYVYLLGPAVYVRTFFPNCWFLFLS